MTAKSRKFYLPLLYLFLIISILVQCFKSSLEGYDFDTGFLLVANLLLLLLSLTAIYLQRKGLKSINSHYFVRTVYMAIIVKMFICMIAILIYVFKNTTQVSKGSIFAAMFIYLLYAAIEVTMLIKSAGKKTNA